MTARVTDVHRILASGSEVCKKNLVVLDSNGRKDSSICVVGQRRLQTDKDAN